MKFKYIDRGKKQLLVLIPGWASDWRIFAGLNMEFNYLLPVNFSPFTFKQALLETLKGRKIKEVSLFAWSLGGFVACEFACEHPGLVDEVILVSIRKKYNPAELKKISGLLKRNKKGYLYKFYQQCFPQKARFRWFKENLLEDYCANFSLNYLLQGLDYLRDAEIKPELFRGLKRVKIIHGEQDAIAPIQEAKELRNDLSQVEFISIKEAGHIPWLINS